MLIEQWPVLAGQLRAALVDSGEAALADQVDGLVVVATCGCGDDFCQSFYVQPPPNGPYPFPDRARCLCIDDPPWEGMLVLDVVDERIAYVEVLSRPPLD